MGLLYIKAKDGDRNAHFGEPDVLVLANLHAPEGIPIKINRTISGSVVEDDQVDSQSGGRRQESERVLVVVKGVKYEPEIVRVSLKVVPTKRRLPLQPAADESEQPRARVQRKPSMSPNPSLPVQISGSFVPWLPE